MENDEKLKLLIEVIRQGEKADQAPLIGMEFEHIVVKADTLSTVTYYEEKGIHDILIRLLEKGFNPAYDGEYLIGMEMSYGLITLEPGGQLELSIRPCGTLKEAEACYQQFLKDVVPLLEVNGQVLLAIGYHPRTTIAEIPFNPKKRYRFMSEYLKDTGRYAHNMMKGTAALQVAIDYRDEADFIKKYRVAHFLIPVLALISDNSPIFEGKPAPQHSVRSLIWEHTDPARSGIVPGVMDESFGYECYARYLLNIPPIFIMKDGSYLPTETKTLSQVLDETVFNEAEVEHLFSMVFPDVRVKRYIEIRVGDSLPMPLNIAYGALLKGIFYHDDNLEALYRQSLQLNTQGLQGAKQQMIELGYDALFLGKPIGEMALELLERAEIGLPPEEKGYLAPLRALVMEKKSPSDYARELVQKDGVIGLIWCAQSAQTLKRGV